jgi:recombination protein RecT
LTKEIQKADTRTMSERFTNAVIGEFQSTIGGIELSSYQKKLAQHLFIKVDIALKDLEAKREKDKRKVSPYEWKNVNMEKLAIDGIHRIELGLDALIPNHISVIPYFNGKKSLYDLDLRIGYEGNDYYRRNMATEKPVNIIYELVYSKDKFTVIKKSNNQKLDSYEFQIKNPFDRGDIIGGFGYIEYKDNSQNVLVLVSEKEFLSSKSAAQSKKFWDKHQAKMRMKTLVHRTTEHIKLDPEKINASFLIVENQELEAVDVLPDNSVKDEINQNANEEIIDIPQEEPGEDGMTESEKKEITAQEAAEGEKTGPDF